MSPESSACKVVRRAAGGKGLVLGRSADVHPSVLNRNVAGETLG
jgi:hypothetical protein